MSRKPRNLKTDLRSAIRRVWLYSDLRNRAVTRARKARGIYRCEACSTLTNSTGFEVDHVVKATPPEGINGPEDWGKFIGNLLYCGDEGLVVLCKPCHEKKTQRERDDVKLQKIAQKKAKKLRNKQPRRPGSTRHLRANSTGTTGRVHRSSSRARGKR